MKPLEFKKYGGDTKLGENLNYQYLKESNKNFSKNKRKKYKILLINLKVCNKVNFWTLLEKMK